MIYKLTTYFMLGILLAVASVFLGSIHLANYAGYRKDTLINKFSYTPKGRHRRE